MCGVANVCELSSMPTSATELASHHTDLVITDDKPGNDPKLQMEQPACWKGGGLEREIEAHTQVGLRPPARHWPARKKSESLQAHVVEYG